MDLLISHNADVNIVNNNKENCLIIACLNEHLNIVKKVIELTNNINEQDCNGMTALMISSKNNNNEIIELLLNNKNIDLDITDNNGMKAQDYSTEILEKNTSRLPEST